MLVGTYRLDEARAHPRLRSLVRSLQRLGLADLVGTYRLDEACAHPRLRSLVRSLR